MTAEVSARLALGGHVGPGEGVALCRHPVLEALQGTPAALEPLPRTQPLLQESDLSRRVLLHEIANMEVSAANSHIDLVVMLDLHAHPPRPKPVDALGLA